MAQRPAKADPAPVSDPEAFAFVQELAAELHSYYFKHRIISDDLALTCARMYLVKSVRTVVAAALRLLGVSAPESM